MGMGKSESHTDFVFEKNEFFPGEQAKVKIICDNSKCSKAVKSFKFKIHREYKAYSHRKEHVTHSEGYVTAVKEQGCKAKSKLSKEFVVKIPNHDVEREQYFETHADEKESL
jgi:hypothetical protein